MFRSVFPVLAIGLSPVTYYDKWNSIYRENGLLFRSVGKSCCRRLDAKAGAA